MDKRPNEFLTAEVRDLFINTDAELVWTKATATVLAFRPDFDFTRVRAVFDDMLRLFNGSYPDYSRIQTPYHDLSHTLSVFICAVRLSHGVHLSDTKLNDQEISLIMIAALLHDIGYAQQLSESAGSGAQLIRQHIERGVAFTKLHARDWQLPAAWEEPLAALIRCTGLGHNLSHIAPDSVRQRLLGQIVGSADMLGQMADRNYLEKLMFLYTEFEEAHFGNYQNMQDLLKKSRSFYEQILETLDQVHGGVYERLRLHFQATLGSDHNYYLESIDKNIAYLDKVIALDEAEWLPMLKRHNVARAVQQKFQQSLAG